MHSWHRLCVEKTLDTASQQTLREICCSLALQSEPCKAAAQRPGMRCCLQIAAGQHLDVHSACSLRSAVAAALVMADPGALKALQLRHTCRHLVLSL